eukprot:m.92165 g.92165  ORF g.92165 m.92165 type:complete len:166 (+) comp14656_c0_seq1:91-588(+)
MLRFVLSLALVAVASATLCAKPEVTSTAASSGAPNLYSETSYLVQFTVKCDGENVEGEPLFAQVQNEFYPVSFDEEGNYQVSWNVPHKVAVSGGETVKIFDQEGYTRAQKAVREGKSTAGTEAFTVYSSFSAPFDLKLPVPPQFIAMACFTYAVVFLFRKTRNVD